MPKTVLINGYFLQQKISGVQRYAAELISALAGIPQDKYRYLLVMPGGRQDLVQNIEGVEIVFDNSCLNPAVWTQFKLPLLAKKMGADILWSPCNVGPILPLVTHVVNVFDASVYNDQNWFAWKFKTYYKILFGCYRYTASRLVTCSEFSKTEIVKYTGIPADRVYVVYGAISDNFRKVSGKTKLDGKYILSLGSRDPRKNISSLIKAWEQLPALVKNGRRLAIVGGKSKAFAEERLSPEVEDIVFLGYVPDEELPALYSNADCFVYPSFYEGFGLPPLEAMACGCPVVVSEAASLPEVCGDSALYINPYSVKSIADGICVIITDEKKRKEFLDNAVEVAKRFTWGKSASELFKVLDQAGGH